MSRRCTAGFSLIELVLALGLFAMLASFVFTTMDSVLRLWADGERRGQGELGFAALAERFRKDLEALHTGHRGWLELEQVEVLPADGDRPPVFLPRLRFLADGAGLPMDDPEGLSGVEILWGFEVEDAREGLFRLVRLSRIERLDAGETLRDDRTAADLMRLGEGMVLADGVAWCRLEALDTDGEWKDSLRIDPETPFDFPSRLRLEIERVEGNLRTRPPLLDRELPVQEMELVLRGEEALGAGGYLLVGREWIRHDGGWPRPRILERGARNTLPALHERRSPVWMPRVHRTEAFLRAGGRRIPRPGWRKGVFLQEENR